MRIPVLLPVNSQYNPAADLPLAHSAMLGVVAATGLTYKVRSVAPDCVRSVQRELRSGHEE